MGQRQRGTVHHDCRLPFTVNQWWPSSMQLNTPLLQKKVGDFQIQSTLRNREQRIVPLFGMELTTGRVCAVSGGQRMSRNYGLFRP